MRRRSEVAARGLVIAGTMSSLYACSHAWDEYDPRLSSASGSSNSSGSTISSSSSSSSSSSGVGGAGGAGGASSSSHSSSSSSTSTTSSSGVVVVWDGGACVEGALCYTGPKGTLDAGVCSFGTLECAGDAGLVCSGETLPTPDDCKTSVDRDCSGVVNDHCGLWSVAWGMSVASSTTEAYDVAVTDAGHVLVTGGTHGPGLTWSTDAGPVSLKDGVYTLELDSPSALTFNQYGGDASVGTSAALDGDGGAYLVGAVYGGSTIDFGKNYKPVGNNATAWGLFAGQLENDTPAWFAAYPGVTARDVTPLAVAVAPTGSVYITGTFAGPLILDGGAGGADAATLSGAAAGTGLVMALNQPNGALAWTLALGGLNQTLIDTVAVTTTAKEIVVGGSFADTMLSIGEASLTVPNGMPGVATGLVATIDILPGSSMGVPQLAKQIPGTGPVYVDSVAVRDAAIVVAGHFTGIADFSQAPVFLAGPDAGSTEDAGTGDAGSTCTSYGKTAESALFVMYLRSDLTCVWAEAFTNPSGFAGPTPTADFAPRIQGFGPQVAVDAKDSVYVALNMGPGLTMFGSWAVPGSSASTIVVMNLIPATGAPNWVRAFPATTAYVTGLATDGDSNLYISGQFQPELDIVPAQPLMWSDPGHSASFIAKLSGGT